MDEKAGYCQAPIGVVSVLLQIHTHTFVPVPQHSHDVEADGLVGALFQHCGRQTLIGPLQSWEDGTTVSCFCGPTGSSGGGREGNPTLP